MLYVVTNLKFNKLMYFNTYLVTHVGGETDVSNKCLFSLFGSDGVTDKAR